MRIISGKYKGKMISPPAGLGIRPTTDFAKTALFNILNNHFDFEEISVLDLFCGSGSITFEFFSRGCLNIIAVDKNFNCVKFIRDFSKTIGADHLKVVCHDAFKLISASAEKFDIVFADPPYAMKEVVNLPGLIFDKGLLMPGGWFILEHLADHSFEDHPNFKEKRSYGSVSFSIFVNTENKNTSI
jgi:16S rRNA (guanine966-N2)-methyltransferase